MGIIIDGNSGYLHLDSWIMSNIIQLATRSFCRRFLTRSYDPDGRQFGQMTQAARSGQANIAEGSARQTSTETELKLLDVARASIAELSSDYLQFLMDAGQLAWSNNVEGWKFMRSTRLDPANYTEDLMHDVSLHILNQKAKFQFYIENENPFVCANAMLILCGRLMRMLDHQMKKRLEKFRTEGGFTEAMTQERLKAISEKAAAEGAPNCPICGKPMVKRYAKKGAYQNQPFWGCVDYPRCPGPSRFQSAQNC